MWSGCVLVLVSATSLSALATAQAPAPAQEPAPAQAARRPCDNRCSPTPTAKRSRKKETVLNLPRRCAGIRVASGLRPEAKYGVETNGPTQRSPYTVARGSKAHTSVARYAPQDDGVF